PPGWLVDDVSLTFDLQPTRTRVRSRIAFRANPDRVDGAPRPPFRLDGRRLTLIAAAIDGVALAESALSIDEEGLTVAPEAIPGDRFTWTCETEIDPKANTALEGLYMSRDMFCTQCEAQGFRKITFYPDRPDVMAVFSVRIEADQDAYPVLLSNGNPTDRGALPEDRHFAEWRDPHPKPSYLFALVAGDLVASNDSFTTRSGRRVDLALFTRRGDETKTAFALDALKRSMRWDEAVYGLEYDLDLFMIVAVDDFNMGAMENKGLNIFNSKYILASPDTATDRDYELIESVVAHEYFHNWTGNRITCRDWFQLCLKEGLTVFRDQQFTEDARSEAVERIESVQMLRARQFREDAGPLAHPVRPESYVEINNFYTATVYEKGAEVVRMLRAVAGPDGYRRALDLYFERHDGQACTVEDFARCFEDACGLDLEQFRLWWSQAGTPRVRAEGAYDPEARRYALTLSQETKPTPNQPEKAALLIPFAVGLLTDDGAEIATPAPEGARPGPGPTHLLMLDAAEKTFVFEAVPSPPVLSLNRGFSAPVVVERKASEAERAFLLSCDTDPFARWEAGRSLAIDAVAGVAADLEAGRAPREVTTQIDALGATQRDAELEPAFRALALKLPSDDELAAEVAGRPRPDGAPGWAHPHPRGVERVRIRPARRAVGARPAGHLGRQLVIARQLERERAVGRL
ncbi:MAG: aminopeptidase N, partial [Pseudomonadota bacterium]